MSYFLIFIGGGLGSVCRYALAIWLPWKGEGIPWSTFWANLLSCMVIGLLLGLANKSLLSDQGKWLLTIGFCGGFSTFSTFSKEIFRLLQTGHLAIASLYIAISIILCLVGVFVGLKFAESVF